MAIKVGINGFGRIGRSFFRAVREYKDIEIVAINDLADVESLAYLLRHDSVYGKPPFSVEARENALVIDGKEISVSHEMEPAHIGWDQKGADIVVESTGAFASYAKAKAHLNGGAKRVVVTAPVKDSPEDAGIEGATVLMGVNEERLRTCQITSNASCTTNAASPLIGILSEGIGIERAILNTVHGYTASQSLVDGPHRKDSRRGRAAAVNIVPSTTGAAVATTLAHEGLKDKFDGIAFRVPVVSGSIVDVTFVASRETNIGEVNDVMKKAAENPRWSQVFAVTEEPLVSTDIIGEPYGAIAELSMTRVVDKTLVKVLAWYDNEMGYAHTLARHVKEFGTHI